MNTYDVGDKVRIACKFTDVDDVETNPTVTVFKFTDPSGNTITYTYDTDDELERDSTGNFHVDITIDEPGTWYYRWIGTGTVVAAEEGSFYVREPRIT